MSCISAQIQLNELLSLPGCPSLFENFLFLCVWYPRSSPRGNGSFGATPATARRTIFHISSCRVFRCGTYGRSCRKDCSQWIEVIQTRASGTAALQCGWHGAKLVAWVPVEQLWRERCNARKWRFERKCFRANIETIAADVQKSGA